MPFVTFDTLPDDARVWTFGSDRALDASESATLLAAVDRHLATWKAHGTPLTAAREWRDGRFFVIGVDQWAAHASGCSIDALFQVLRAVESQLRVSLLGGGRVFYRDAEGAVTAASRSEFSELSSSGSVTGDTIVFDPTITLLGEWRARFETSASNSWHASLLTAAVR